MSIVGPSEHRRCYNGALWSIVGAVMERYRGRGNITVATMEHVGVAMEHCRVRRNITVAAMEHLWAAGESPMLQQSISGVVLEYGWAAGASSVRQWSITSASRDGRSSTLLATRRYSRGRAW